MKLLILVGSGAVGKMTVGQSIMRKTALRLFHNHMMIEPSLRFSASITTPLLQNFEERFLKSF